MKFKPEDEPFDFDLSQYKKTKRDESIFDNAGKSHISFVPEHPDNPYNIPGFHITTQIPGLGKKEGFANGFSIRDQINLPEPIVPPTPPVEPWKPPEIDLTPKTPYRPDYLQQFLLGQENMSKPEPRFDPASYQPPQELKLPDIKPERYNLPDPQPTSYEPPAEAWRPKIDIPGFHPTPSPLDIINMFNEPQYQPPQTDAYHMPQVESSPEPSPSYDLGTILDAIRNSSIQPPQPESWQPSSSYTPEDNSPSLEERIGNSWQPPEMNFAGFNQSPSLEDIVNQLSGQQGPEPSFEPQQDSDPIQYDLEHFASNLNNPDFLPPGILGGGFEPQEPPQDDPFFELPDFDPTG